MCKTGSVSMKAAYEELGIPCYHGFDFTDEFSHRPLWEKAINAKYHGKGKPFTREDFDAFLGDWGALSDIPAIGFAEELMAMYPEVSFVTPPSRSGHRSQADSKMSIWAHQQTKD
jgi:hypothetical protein